MKAPKIKKQKHSKRAPKDSSKVKTLAVPVGNAVAGAIALAQKRHKEDSEKKSREAAIPRIKATKSMSAKEVVDREAKLSARTQMMRNRIAQLTELCEKLEFHAPQDWGEYCLADQRRREIGSVIYRIVKEADYQQNGAYDLCPKVFKKRSALSKEKQITALSEAFATLLKVIEETDVDIIGALTFVPPAWYRDSLITFGFDGDKRWDKIEDFKNKIEAFGRTLNELMNDRKIRQEKADTERTILPSGKKKAGRKTNEYYDDLTRKLMDLYEASTALPVKRNNKVGAIPNSPAVAFIGKAFEILGIRMRESALDRKIGRIISTSKKPRQKGRPSKNGQNYITPQ